MDEARIDTAGVDAAIDPLEQAVADACVEEVDGDVGHIPVGCAAFDHGAELGRVHWTVLHHAGTGDLREGIAITHFLGVLIGAAPTGEDDRLALEIVSAERLLAAERHGAAEPQGCSQYVAARQPRIRDVSHALPLKVGGNGAKPFRLGCPLAQLIGQL